MLTVAHSGYHQQGQGVFRDWHTDGRTMIANSDYIRACYFGCFKGVSKSCQAPLSGIEAVVALALIILKQRALYIVVL